MQQGNEQFKRGDFQGAIASFEKSIKIKPDDYKAWYNQGLALDQLGQYEEAIASYDEAITLKLDFHEAWYNRGNAQIDLGRLKQAIASYDKAVKYKPNYPEAWTNRGICLRKLGNNEEAIISFNHALDINPNFPEVCNTWNSRGLALADLGQYQDAIASFEKAIEIKPDDPTAWDNWDFLVRKQPNPFPYWLNAKDICLKALELLTSKEELLRYLQVLPYLFKVCDYLGNTQVKEEQLEQGTQHLETLVSQCQTEGYKITLERKFAFLNQFRVDILAQSTEQNKHIEALELAEKRKNTCLGWLQNNWDYQPPSPNYREMQKLLNPRTAVIYWHISPVAFTTFIIKHNQPPIVFPPIPPPEKQRQLFQRQSYSAATYQLHRFEDWMKEWKQNYQNYQQGKSTTWRDKLEKMLRGRNGLLNVLEINRLQKEYLQDVDQLILFPHRELHLLPIHALFPGRYTITYLPSFQIGLQLQLRPDRQNITNMLNIENPAQDLPFAAIESVALSHFYPNDSLDISTITRPNLLQSLRTNTDCFHFTGHGYHEPEQPRKSALRLAESDELTLGDIFDQNLDFSQYQLICLSACETGITSRDNLIDEYVGLVSGFLAKGASYVVSSLWQVDERSTALLLIKFYQLLKQNKHPAIALKEAQSWLRYLTFPALAKWYRALVNEIHQDRNARSYLNTEAQMIEKDPAKMESEEAPFNDPYHWAGFILTGKPIQ